MEHPGWHRALEALRDGVALVDAGGRLVSCNRAFRSLTGFDGGAGDLLEPSLPWIADALGEAGGAVDEVPVGRRWLDVRVERLDREGAVVTVSDVTERRRTAEQLRASNEILQALVEAAPVAILTVDLDQRVTMWNRSAERMFGWTASEIVGRPYTAVVPAEDAHGFEQLFERVIGGEGFTGVEARRVRRDGKRVDVGISTAPLRDASGAVVGAMAILDDLTDKKRLEEQVRQVERMEAIGRLAGGIAHDFNNLLTIILSACDLLEDAPDPGTSQRLLGDVRRGAERAADLTRQLLAFSRRQVLQPARIDLNEAVGEAAAMLERVIGEDIEVVLALDPEPLPVVADRGQLHRVVLNLAVNARDAMPTGGRLTVTTRRLPDHEQPEHLTGGPYVELAIRDTGHGVEPEALPHIFEPFFTTKAPGKGTGLGLAMVYGVVQQSGGEVVVDSAPSRGTTFRVVLPQASGESTPAPRPDPARPASRPAGATVLLVEDDDEVRVTLRELLRALGYRVLVAGGGAEALAVSDAHGDRVDVLLTDVVMAGMSGREVAEAVLARRPETRVLFMSGYTDDATLRHGVRSAGTSFIQKPFTSAALDAQIRRLLGGG